MAKRIETIGAHPREGRPQPFSTSIDAYSRSGCEKSALQQSGDACFIMTQPDAEIVQFDNVGLRYGTGKEVLTDVSFTLFPAISISHRRQRRGQDQPAALLYLAQRPSRGLIRMFGTDAITLPRDRLPGFRRRLGVVFQDFRLVPHLSAFDNVALPLRVAGMVEKDIVRPVNDMLDWVAWPTGATPSPPRFPAGAAARGDCPRGDRPARTAHRRRTDRQRRCGHGVQADRPVPVAERLGTTVVVATHDPQLIRQVPDSLIMRLDKGKLLDPTGALRYPRRSAPARQRVAAGWRRRASPGLRASHHERLFLAWRGDGRWPARSRATTRRACCPKRACPARCPG
jgi:cell division transport system ATP-binding protein